MRGLHFVTMTEYESNLPVHVAFPQLVFPNTLGHIFSQHGLRQLRIAETEKYAHVTFFFNGLSDTVLEGEDHLVVPSAHVDSYSKKPEMSVKELTALTIKDLIKDKHDVYIMNFANADMVAHTGDVKATIKGIETIDRALGELVEVMLSRDGVMLITADHGNAEEVLNLQTGEIDKEHSTNPVPFIVVGKNFEGKTLGNIDSVNSDLSLCSRRSTF